MEKLFRGILKYRQTTKNDILTELTKIGLHPHPTAIMFTCVDPRLLPSRITQTDIGDMFIMRNPGNFIPPYNKDDSQSFSGELCLLEIGSTMGNSIKDIVVMGHSDCKAMIALSQSYGQDSKSNSGWLTKQGQESINRYELLKKSHFTEPLVLVNKNEEIVSYIDTTLSSTDILSQINTLVQMSNLSSYDFIGQFSKHALWYDFRNANILYFSRSQKAFVSIDEGSIDGLLEDIKR